MTDQVSLTVEPDLYPGIIMVGIIVMKRTGMQNVGISCREPGQSAIKFHIAGSLQHAFKYIMISVESSDVVIRIAVADPGGKRGKFRRSHACVRADLFRVDFIKVAFGNQ